MATTERLVDRGRERARRLRTTVGNDLKGARLEHDLAQEVVSEASGIPQSWYSLMERGMAPGVTLEDLAVACQVVGLDLVLKTYPSGLRIRDAPQLELLADFRPLLARSARWQTEVPFDIPGDQRSWDAVIGLDAVRIGVGAETRLRDIQAVERRVNLKKRDSGVDRVILLVRASRSNLTVIRAMSDQLRANFPVDSKTALAALRAGRDPGGDALVLLPARLKASRRPARDAA